VNRFGRDDDCLFKGKKTMASAKADPCGMTTKEHATARATARAF
jgi:hypothetical protein